jgi:putative ABC transport system permease protein
MKLFAFILKNLGRHKLRTALTALAIYFLVAILTLIATVLRALETSMAEKERDIKLLITERSNADTFSRSCMEDIMRPDSKLNAMLRKIPGFDPDGCATWNFMIYTLDKEQKNEDKLFIAVATQPDAIVKVAEGLQDLPDAERLVREMRRPPRSRTDNIGILMGPERMRRIGKKVGDVFPAYLLDPDPTKRFAFEFEIVGALPGDSRWTVFTIMELEYFTRQQQAIKSGYDGLVDMGWVVAHSQEAASRVANTITTYLPQVKCETLSASLSRRLDPYKDLLAGIKYVLVPAIYFVMTLILANAIAITVRERRHELAVLKVLGFGGWRLLFLILGEGLLIGVLAGALGAWSLYGLVNLAMNGIKIPMGFFPYFWVPNAALWWGPATGAAVALIGCALPVWHAKRVNVVDVFAKVA